MPTRFQPIAGTEQTASPYTLQQLDEKGEILSESRTVATSCAEAIRGLKGIVDDAERIVAYNDNGKKVGQVNVDYWRLKKGRL